MARRPSLSGWRPSPSGRGGRLRAATKVMMGWSLVTLLIWAGFWAAVLFAGLPYGLWRPIMGPVLALALIHAVAAFARAGPPAGSGFDAAPPVSARKGQPHQGRDSEA